MLTPLDPYDLVMSSYKFGKVIDRRQQQVDAVNALAELPRTGLYAETSTGKTFMATAAALYKKKLDGGQWIVMMPPILIKQWYQWLVGIEGVTATMYRGSPARRKTLKLEADFILMTIQVFKRDYEYLSDYFAEKKVGVIVDEARCIKNVGSDNYRALAEFVETRELQLLTATPLSNPGDAYAYIKQVSPPVYRSQAHFEAVHVGGKDIYDEVVKWENLDLLQSNLMLNSVRLLQREVNPDMPEPDFIPIPYELDKKHMALYRKLMDEQLLLLPQGGKIDATSAMKLRTCAQQIICNPLHFSGDPSIVNSAFALLDQILDELLVKDKINGHKLLVFAWFRMTNRALQEHLKPYGAVACFGDISPAQQIANLERFKTDPDCRVAVLQPGSAGQGVDGLQHMCWDELFLEMPSASDFRQAAGRIDRYGQRFVPRIRIGVAEGTVQVGRLRDILKKDELVQQVAPSWSSLRDEIYGN